ncbi:hypothetical protein QBC36DRAFT_7535 [Triangularia setosa]|uniref:Uncharacterized protein n=1 Tax=Triangularia setosa TaxID=2587417 RepID=A0AAN6W7P9_9PEZI|nr:hypothetical protein QBC36DRAFT_7535 [Podospora setosa]
MSFLFCHVAWPSLVFIIDAGYVLVNKPRLVGPGVLNIYDEISIPRAMLAWNQVSPYKQLKSLFKAGNVPIRQMQVRSFEHGSRPRECTRGRHLGHWFQLGASGVGSQNKLIMRANRSTFKDCHAGIYR